MGAQPVEVNLEITPSRRFEIIDVSRLVREEAGDVLDRYRKSAYCSLHTTAGYLEQGVCARLGRSSTQLDPFFRAIQRIFPHDAGYSHDRLELRAELSDSEKAVEPINADSHLTFIGAGLRNCVTYLNHRAQPAYFIELDGVFRDQRRQRRTTVIAYDQDEVVHRHRIALRLAPNRMIDSLNLKDPRYGLFEQLEELLRREGVDKGRIDIRLAPDEKHAGLTVNEYETLLMRDDLPEVLRDPLRYMMRRGRKLLRNPLSIPGKTRGYATYDLIHLYNELMDSLPIGRAVVDRIMAVLSHPASRILRLKRQVSLLASASPQSGPGRIVQGTYQSPILMQHHPPESGVRHLDIVIRSFH